MSEVQFISGLRVYKPRENAPTWIIANGTINKNDILTWLGQQDDDEIRFDIKLSKKGTYYATVNNYKTEDKIQGVPF